MDLKIPRVGRQHLGTKPSPQTQKRSGPWWRTLLLVGSGGMVLLEVALYDEFYRSFVSIVFDKGNQFMVQWSFLVPLIGGFGDI